LRKITIIFHHAGGGHRNAAEALKSTLAGPDQNWDVTLLDIQELLAPLDVMHRATGLQIQDTYNLILRRGWTRFTPELLKVLQTAIRVYHAPIVKVLRTYWKNHPNDIVLSVIPHFNREIAESVRQQLPDSKFITLLTDMADYPPRFWIEKESEYIIAGTERARQQALAMGHHPTRIFRASGMILKPKFYNPPVVDRVAERKRLGLDPHCATGIVLFGGHGARVMVDIADKINRSRADVQLIMICGHNQKLASELKALKTRKPMLVEGFTSNIEHYMAVSDFFIGKPGPGSISEALQCHLPVIVECNSSTMPQERYNAQWVSEHGYGIVLKSFGDISDAVEKLIEPDTLAQFRAAVSQYSNHALSDAAQILEICYGSVTKTETIAPIGAAQPVLAF
jgi:Glycosyltransferase family 28 C-terminal domain